jgi:hypothetical protein
MAVLLSLLRAGSVAVRDCYAAPDGRQRRGAGDGDC